MNSSIGRVEWPMVKIVSEICRRASFGFMLATGFSDLELRRGKWWARTMAAGRHAAIGAAQGTALRADRTCRS